MFLMVIITITTILPYHLGMMIQSTRRFKETIGPSLVDRTTRGSFERTTLAQHRGRLSIVQHLNSFKGTQVPAHIQQENNVENIYIYNVIYIMLYIYNVIYI